MKKNTKHTIALGLLILAVILFVVTPGLPDEWFVLIGAAFFEYWDKVFK